MNEALCWMWFQLLIAFWLHYIYSNRKWYNIFILYTVYHYKGAKEHKKSILLHIRVNLMICPPPLHPPPPKVCLCPENLRPGDGQMLGKRCSLGFPLVLRYTCVILGVCALFPFDVLNSCNFEMRKVIQYPHSPLRRPEMMKPDAELGLQHYNVSYLKSFRLLIIITVWA